MPCASSSLSSGVGRKHQYSTYSFIRIHDFFFFYLEINYRPDEGAGGVLYITILYTCRVLINFLENPTRLPFPSVYVTARNGARGRGSEHIIGEEGEGRNNKNV